MVKIQNHDNIYQFYDNYIHPKIEAYLIEGDLFRERENKIYLVSP
mgnify:CR=1 FL=1